MCCSSSKWFGLESPCFARHYRCLQVHCFGVLSLFTSLCWNALGLHKTSPDSIWEWIIPRVLVAVFKTAMPTMFTLLKKLEKFVITWSVNNNLYKFQNCRVQWKCACLDMFFFFWKHLFRYVICSFSNNVLRCIILVLVMCFYPLVPFGYPCSFKTRVNANALV